MENPNKTNPELFRLIAHYFCNVPKLVAIPNLQLIADNTVNTVKSFHLAKQGWHQFHDYANIADFLTNFSGNIKNSRLEQLTELARSHSFLYDYTLEPWLSFSFPAAIQAGYRELLIQEALILNQRLIDTKKQSRYNQLIAKYKARFTKHPEEDLITFQRWATMQIYSHQQLLQELHPHLSEMALIDHHCPTIWQETLDENIVPLCDPLILLLEIRVITGIKQVHIWTEQNYTYSVILDEWGRIGNTELNKIQLIAALNSLITQNGILLVESKASVGSQFICRALGIRNRQIEKIANNEIAIALKQAQAYDNMWIEEWKTKLV